MSADHDNNRDLSVLLADLARIEAIVSAWDESQRKTVAEYRRTIETLHGEALRRLIGSLRTDPAALAALKETLGDEIVYAVLRHHEIIKPSLNERIETALTELRPSLAAHGGDVELVRFAPPKIELRFIGACDGCAASALTFQAGVKRALQTACPEITEIVQVKGLGGRRHADFTSPFAVDDSSEPNEAAR
jgi:Fe-S cluster biogenesis protein NfuA